MSIETEARKYARQAMEGDKKPSYSEAERQLRRGLIWQVMEECRYTQTDAAKALGVNRSSLRSWIGWVFTESEMKQMGIEP
jgi:DNA-binding protein Fis